MQRPVVDDACTRCGMRTYKPSTEIEMNKLIRFQESSTFSMFSNEFAGAKFAVALSGFAMLACSSVSEVTEQRVERSATVVRQAQLAVGQSEEGAVELQKATAHLAGAKAALANNEDAEAGRLAQQAQLQAESSVARAESGHARRAASEVSASLETLRQEAGRP